MVAEFEATLCDRAPGKGGGAKRALHGDAWTAAADPRCQDRIPVDAAVQQEPQAIVGEIAESVRAVDAAYCSTSRQPEPRERSAVDADPAQVPRAPKPPTGPTHARVLRRRTGGQQSHV